MTNRSNMKDPANQRRGGAGRSRGEPPAPSTAPIVIPVAREELHVTRRRRATGTVRLAKTVRQRIEVIDEPIVHEDVVVERVPVDRIVDAAPAPRQDGDTLVLSVVAEVLVKQLRVVEEVRITRRRRVERQHSTVSLLTERVDVERRRAAPPANAETSPRRSPD
jgi:uncharacterized protein (TIGR02271 family)